MNTYRIVLKPAVFFFFCLTTFIIAPYSALWRSYAPPTASGSSTCAYAQTLPFQNYGIKEGLAQSTVYDIIQDSKGYLWFGTENGASKFDGKTFKTYATEDGLTNNNVLSIMEDSKGNLWFGTNGGGISKFDGKYFKNFNSQQGLASDVVISILEDEVGQIWFGTIGGGISKLALNDSMESSYIFENFTTENGLGNNNAYTLMEDKNHNLWVGLFRGGLSLMSYKEREKAAKERSKANFVTFTTNDGLILNSVKSIVEDKNGNIWVGTGGGISKFKANNNGLPPAFENYTTDQGLVDNNVLTINIDQNGNIWIGTTGGVSKLIPQKSENSDFTFENFTTQHGLVNNIISSILEDENGNIWFGTFGGGISKFAGNAFQNFTTEHQLINDNIRSVLEDHNSDIWFTYRGGISKLVQNDQNGTIEIEHFSSELRLTNEFVTCILEDKNNNLWFGCERLGVFILQGNSFLNISTDDGIIDNSVRTIYEDSNGNIWLGTDGYGISRLQLGALQSPLRETVRKRELKVENFTEENGLANSFIHRILQDHQGNMWFATNGGISVLTGQTTLSDQTGKSEPIFKSYTTKDGLGSNVVFSILEDTKNNLWFATEGGLSRYDGIAFQNFTKKDGLHSNHLWLIVEDNEGNIWVGHEKGIEKVLLPASPGNSRGKDSLPIEFIYYGHLEGFTPIETNANAVYKDSEGNLWFGTIGGLVKYDPKEDRINVVEPRTHITNLRLFGKETDFLPWCDSVDRKTNLPINLKLPYDKNNITFKYIGIHFKIPEKVRYQYMLEGLDRDWSEITAETFTKYTNIEPGKYTFKVKACNSDGIWNKKATEFSLVITPPFWQTWWYYTSEILFCFTLIAISFYVNKSTAKSRIATVFTLIAIILVFEFVNIAIEPYIDDYSGEVPLIKLALNVMLALSLNPLEKLISHFDKYI
ncbi:MAG: hypothetical protein FVQ77_13060 [Cytophagales bacterium]|nr:hypothetical protein [Cytophagales bacterium]